MQAKGGLYTRPMLEKEPTLFAFLRTAVQKVDREFYEEAIQAAGV
jgi:hypothetical protein